MLIQYVNDWVNMESTTMQRRTIMNPSLPLRSKYPESSVGLSAATIRYRRIDGVVHRTDIPLPPYSPISDRSGSSFSYDSPADLWETISTEPSPPQTPRPKHEIDDGLRLDLASTRGFKRKCESQDEDSRRVKLPPVYKLLPPNEQGDRRPASRYRPRKSWKTPCSSPEPSNEYTLSTKPTSSPLGDPIVQWLNNRRMESSDVKNLLSQPRGLGEASLRIDLNFSSPQTQTVFYREKQQYTPQSRSYCHRSRQQPSPPREEPNQCGDAKVRKSHNNIKYSIEETDYIRYNKYEKKLPWEESKKLFRKKFPMTDVEKNRGTQGIQGNFYRDNHNLPLLTNRGRVLVFQENGHVKPITAKVRDQKEDKPYFSLTYLYPERAMLYDWVDDEHKRFAEELAKERILQKEHAQREAKKRNMWKEKLEPGECACCPEPDRERDNHKRAAPEYPADGSNIASSGAIPLDSLKMPLSVKSEDMALRHNVMRNLSIASTV
ncbi:hypothetical protein F5Y04DRAFT_116160 [Hypomontagnella monticulosa]|nr:hypothetical protein F5Y04DRAFT_116160 [Hypomontagnella monticulosa]